MKFDELDVNNGIKRAIKEMNLVNLTEIQERSIPLILNSQNVLGKSVTGSGKTFAFAIPCLENALQGKKTLVISPTRELAVQLEKEFRKLAKYLKVRTTVVYGGHGMFIEIKKLKEGVDIICGTPGRILDHMMNKTIRKGFFDTLVLDEADRLLDMGFLGEVKSIMENVEPKHIHLFSATLDNKIVRLIKSHLKEYKEVSVENKDLCKNIHEEKFILRNSEKYAKLLEIIKDNLDAKVLIFVSTKRGAEQIKLKLEKQGFFINSIHGDKTQNFREKALEDFKSMKVPILVATDVAARGLHIDNVDIVINYDLGNDPDVYLHRIGRTGRMGKKGQAITFVSEDHVFANRNKKFDVESLDFNPREYMRRDSSSRGRGPSMGSRNSSRGRDSRFGDSNTTNTSRGPRIGGRAPKKPFKYNKELKTEESPMRKTHQGLSEVVSKDFSKPKEREDKNKRFKSRPKNKNNKFQGRFSKKVN